MSICGGYLPVTAVAEAVLKTKGASQLVRNGSA